jgi:hypothetical protein
MDVETRNCRCTLHAALLVRSPRSTTVCNLTFKGLDFADGTPERIKSNGGHPVTTKIWILKKFLKDCLKINIFVANA